MDFTWFQTLAEIFDRLQSTNVFHEFCQLRTNRERIHFIDQHRHVFIDEMLNKFRKQFDDSTMKNLDESIRCRKKGNDAFVKKDLQLATEFYHQSIALAPVNSRELALAYGNLSAVLFESNLFCETLQTIDIALKFYPEDLRSKFVFMFFVIQQEK